MGIYDNASKRVGGGGLFIKTETGKKLRLRILDMPYVSSRKFKPGQPVKTLFAWPVWNYDEERVQILQKGNSVFSQVAAIVEEYGEDLPMACDITLTKKGSGLETEYVLVAAPIKKQLAKGWEAGMPDMDAKIKGGIPLQRFSDGEDPQVQEGDDTYTGDGAPHPAEGDDPFIEEDAGGAQEPK